MIIYQRSSNIWSLIFSLANSSLVEHLFCEKNYVKEINGKLQKREQKTDKGSCCWFLVGWGVPFLFFYWRSGVGNFLGHEILSRVWVVHDYFRWPIACARILDVILSPRVTAFSLSHCWDVFVQNTCKYVKIVYNPLWLSTGRLTWENVARKIDYF